MFKHLNKEADHLEILLEDIKDKFDVVLEGYDAIRKEISEYKQELNEKIEMNSFLIQGLNKKIDSVEERLSKKLDAVADDLAAHRADTESSGTRYKVS
jgi:vacuolar-type H+-ATPase subunit I/STV1